MLYCSNDLVINNVDEAKYLLRFYMFKMKFKCVKWIILNPTLGVNKIWNGFLNFN